MKRSRICKPLIVALPVSVALYAVGASYASTPVADALSAFSVLLAVVSLFYTSARITGDPSHRFTFLALGIGCASWFAADIGWLVLDITGAEPGESRLLWVLYAITNVAILVAFLRIWLVHFNKWGVAQLVADIGATLLASALLIWTVFLHSDPASIPALLKQDFTSIASLFIDAIIVIGAFLWFSSLRSNTLPAFAVVLALSATAYSLVDMVYFYSVLWVATVSALLIDLFYYGALAGLAIGALMRVCRAEPQPAAGSAEGKWRSLWFLLFPAITLAATVFGVAGVSLRMAEYLLFLLIMIVHWGLSRYICIAQENERLLTIEKSANALLEKRVAEQLETVARLSRQDPLTGLGNREHFIARLEEAVKSLDMSELVCVLVADVDRFKTINDHYGPDAADAMLVEFARRLTQWRCQATFIARLGGDEYAIILTGDLSLQDVEAACNELIALFNEPMPLKGSPVSVTVSVGASLRTADIYDGRQLLQNAQLALHQAKSQGYNRYELYDPLLSRATLSAGRIELLLRQANPDRDFELFYQPQFSIKDETLIGAEALLRWRHKEHGYISPTLFIPVAEKTGMIGRIGSWVLQSAARQAKVWQAVRGGLRVGVNLSPLELDEPRFLDRVQSQLQEIGVQPSGLDLEITERMMLSDTEASHAVLYRMKELGFTLSIDDFGSGYAAINYLSRFPFDRLKIDKSLIDGLLIRGGAGYHIVRSIIGMSQSLGLSTLAEGVERTEQLSQLRSLGCDQLQGFLLGRPVPAAEFQRLFLH